MCDSISNDTLSYLFVTLEFNRFQVKPIHKITLALLSSLSKPESPPLAKMENRNEV